MTDTHDSASTAPSASALRMRRHRERRRNGLRCVMIELRASEIDALVRRGLLRAGTHNSEQAIKEALYAFLDQTLGGPCLWNYVIEACQQNTGIRLVYHPHAS